jgi:hypothetical protein
MTMKDSTYRLALISLIIVGLAIFSHAATASAVSGAPSSPTVENAGVTPENKQPTSLICEVDNPEPAVGETITFSGYLRTTEDNLGQAGENITLYKLLSDNDISVGSATTDENGYFTMSLEATGQGIFSYRARFLGDNYYENSESPMLYSSTLDKSLILGGYAGILIAIVGIGIFLLRIGIARIHYLMPVLIGFALGFFLILVGAGMLSILAAGAIAGYLFAKKAPEWTKYLRIGCITGLLFLLALGLIFAYYIVTLPPEVLGVSYSITQTEIFTELFNSAIFTLVYYSLFAGVGAVLGGMLRKLLKPGEQKPPIGSGETTSSGVEQPQETVLPPRQHGDQRNWPDCPPVVGNHGRSS